MNMKFMSVKTRQSYQSQLNKRHSSLHDYTAEYLYYYNLKFIVLKAPFRNLWKNLMTEKYFLIFVTTPWDITNELEDIRTENNRKSYIDVIAIRKL